MSSNPSFDVTVHTPRIAVALALLAGAAAGVSVLAGLVHALRDERWVLAVTLWAAAAPAVAVAVGAARRTSGEVLALRRVGSAWQVRCDSDPLAWIAAASVWLIVPTPGWCLLRVQWRDGDGRSHDRLIGVGRHACGDATWRRLRTSLVHSGPPSAALA